MFVGTQVDQPVNSGLLKWPKYAHMHTICALILSETLALYKSFTCLLTY